MAHGTAFENLEASEGLTAEQLGKFAEEYAEDICKKREELNSRKKDTKSFEAYGIDVSAWQGVIEWKRVKQSANGHFAMLRAAYGTETDARFEQNYSEAKSAGVPVGAYLYSLALTEAEAENEAEKLLELVKGKDFTYPFAFDIEDSAQSKLGAEAVSAIVKAFCSKIEAEGYYVCVYSYEDFLTSCMTPEIFKKYDIWAADVGAVPAVKFGMHQYSFSGEVSGIKSDVDLDLAVKDYPEIIAKLRKDK